MKLDDKTANIKQLTQALKEITFHHDRTGEAIHKQTLENELLKGTAKHYREVEEKRTHEFKVTKEDCEAHIGSRARIINPGRGEANIGYTFIPLVICM